MAETKKALKTTKKASDGFAVIATGGKQYIVREGETITIEKLAGAPKAGDAVSFEVLLVANGDTVSVGTPYLDKKTGAEFIENGKGKKVEVVKYKQKSRYLKRKGHRQPFSKVKISSI